jgi:hypothetical protein
VRKGMIYVLGAGYVLVAVSLILGLVAAHSVGN